ncbi:restriction endonuclease [Geothrix fuzhouensis]|uniref:restriction endonuclease n=1 Tax=Geothrix fuzhouensis TaxID=2966451 RepID=UPI002148AF96|nr:restriction endonuclease [Geothrix fuzhouensis]
MFSDQPISLSPLDFELAVKGILDATGEPLISYTSTHQEKVGGPDGDYVIDVVARFSALNAEFVVLVECKHHKRKVERQDVQVLLSKLQSLGAHKGMLFSTAGFQAGAIEFAKSHGIALVQLADGNTSWFVRSEAPLPTRPDWAGTFKYAGWWHHDGQIGLMSEDFNRFTRQALGLAASEP